MKKILRFLLLVILVVLIVAYFTKPGYDETLGAMTKDLAALGYYAGLSISHDPKDAGAVHSPVTIKDRIFYRDVYFFFNGSEKKIAVAAFSHYFKFRF